jgi:hypothetical protein
MQTTGQRRPLPGLPRPGLGEGAGAHMTAYRLRRPPGPSLEVEKKTPEFAR